MLDRSTRPLASAVPLIGIWISMIWLAGNEIDHQVLWALHSANPTMLAVARLLTELGGWIVLSLIIVCAAAGLFLRNRPQDAIFLLLTTAGGRVLVELQKWLFGRERPDESIRMVEVSSGAFPSGHAANSLITYALIAWLFTKPGNFRTLALGCAVSLSILVGITRLQLGVHWPSDVIAGWCFALIWCLIAGAVLDNRESRGRVLSERA